VYRDFLAAAVMAAVCCTLPRPAAAQQRAGGMRVYADVAQGQLVVESPSVDLPAHGGHTQVLPARAVAPVDGWLHGYQVELVDGHGRRLPQALLHHVIVTVPGRRGLFNPIMLRLVAAGRETPVVHLPSLVGYHLQRGDTLLIAAMLENEGAAAYQGVRIRVRMPVAHATGWIHPVTIFPFSVDVMPTGAGRAWDLPPGRSHRSWQGSPAVAARLLGIGGHLHRYGVALRFEDVTARKVLWTGIPVRDAAGEVLRMPTQTFVRGAELRPDHVYRLTAFYDNPTGRMIPAGGMGAAGGAVIPDSPPAWPGVNRADPEFRLDLRSNSTDPAAHAHDMQGMPGMKH
jgi:hypothetical protein